MFILSLSKYKYSEGIHLLLCLIIFGCIILKDPRIFLQSLCLSHRDNVDTPWHSFMPLLSRALLIIVYAIISRWQPWGRAFCLLPIYSSQSIHIFLTQDPTYLCSHCAAANVQHHSMDSFQGFSDSCLTWAFTQQLHIHFPMLQTHTVDCCLLIVMLSCPDSVLTIQVVTALRKTSTIFLSLKHTTQQDSAYVQSPSVSLVLDSIQ